MTYEEMKNEIIAIIDDYVFSGMWQYEKRSLSFEDMILMFEIMMRGNVVENIKSEIYDNAFTITNPRNTYESIPAIDIETLDGIFDKYLGKESEEKDADSD